MDQRKNTITGRDAFLTLLKSEGVTHLFGNPGTTELPIMHAMTSEPDLTYVLGLQEAIVIAMADGFARASGRLVSCNVHVAPGLGNAMGALFTAHYTGTPLILTAGQQEQGHGLTEPLLYGPLVPMAAPCVKWAVEVNRLEDLPRILRRAAKIALTPPTGPVFISLPGDILNGDAAIDLGQATRIDAAGRPSEAALERLVARILEAENPLIVAGPEVVASDAFAEAGDFATALGAPVLQQTVPHGAHFPSEHPCFLGGLTRSQPQVRQVLSDYDLMICLGADVLRMSVYDPVDPLPDDLAVVQIGLNDWEMGKNYPAEIALRADLRETLADLTPCLRARGGAALAAAARARIEAMAARNWTATRASRAATLADKAGESPLDPDWLMLRLAEALPADAIVVDEGITSSRALNAFWPYRDRHSYFGNVSGGIGWAIAAAVGIQMAQPGRRVAAVIGDGSAMYSIQALWSAAHFKQPVIFLIANNGGYRILKQRLKAFHGNEHYIAMDLKDPPVDYTGLARSFGVPAERIETAAEFDAAMSRALASDGPMLLDLIVQGEV